MANFNDAFKPQFGFGNIRKYNDADYTAKNKEFDYTRSTNTINNNFTVVDNAFARVKVSNPKYDNITRQSNKPFYGTTCKLCGGCVGYHISIQEEEPHDFVKGEYRKLDDVECGQYCDGRPMQ